MINNIMSNAIISDAIIIIWDVADGDYKTKKCEQQILTPETFNSTEIIYINKIIMNNDKQYYVVMLQLVMLQWCSIMRP